MLMTRHLITKTKYICNKNAIKTLIVSKKCSSKAESKVAVVLSGSGVLDGSEIYEAVAVAVHLSTNNIKPVFYAPDCAQADVVDHVTKETMTEERNAMVEAARIARGNICPLSELQHGHVSAVVFPGGFGAAKTLCTFANDAENFAINEDVMRIMEEFKCAKKPMAFMCISAIIPARYFCSARITLGKKGDPEKWPHAAAIGVAEKLKATVELKAVDEFSLDKQNLILSTPAYMYNGEFHEIFNGIGNMISNLCMIME